MNGRGRKRERRKKEREGQVKRRGEERDEREENYFKEIGLCNSLLGLASLKFIG